MKPSKTNPTGASPPPIPQPLPLSRIPLPPIPPQYQPAPAPLGVTTGTMTGDLELAVVLKVTYRFDKPDRPVRAEVQLPLGLQNEPHDELVPGVPRSVRAVPELLACAGGTDLVIRAHARPPKPAAIASVEAEAGNLRHTARVTGTRHVDSAKGKLVFTPAAKFEALPLRYELAYGGTDVRFQANAAKQFIAHVPPADLRRVSALAKDILRGVPPVAYPRNPCGKGYVVAGDAASVIGLELPNVERTDDLLAPERLWPERPLLWHRMPVPAGFDYMSATMFPRSAMMGLPPLVEGNLDEVAEVRSGQVPAGYCRGNAFTVEREEIHELIHPEVARCAPIGLRLPFLRGDESIALSGMCHRTPRLVLRLPGERPVFSLPAGGGRRELEPQLAQVFIDVDRRQLCLVWVGRTPWKQALKPGEALELAASVKLGEVKVGGQTG